MKATYMQENLERAKRYSRSKTRLTITEFVLTVAFLMIMLVSGASVGLRNIAAGRSENFSIQVGIYLVIFTVIYYLVFLGPDFYGGFLLEHKFGLSNQTLFGWAKKSGKKLLLGSAMLLIAAELLYFFLRRFPEHWWLLMTAAWFLLTIVVSKIAPVLIIPLFYKCQSVRNNALKERLVKLGENCAVHVKGVFEIQLSKDTRKANAAVAGLGKGRRILLGDTLLENYSNEEIETIFAHELGHVRLLHTWKILAFGAAASLLSFYVTSVLFKAGLNIFGLGQIDDIAAFPLLALIVMLMGLTLLPLQNAYLRRLEKQADLFALKHAQSGESFVSAITKLGNQNLSDPSPSKWEEIFLYDHPPVSKRLDYAKQREIKRPTA